MCFPPFVVDFEANLSSLLKYSDPSPFCQEKKVKKTRPKAGFLKPRLDCQGFGTEHIEGN